MHKGAAVSWVAGIKADRRNIIEDGLKKREIKCPEKNYFVKENSRVFLLPSRTTLSLTIPKDCNALSAFSYCYPLGICYYR